MPINFSDIASDNVMKTTLEIPECYLRRLFRIYFLIQPLTQNYSCLSWWLSGKDSTFQYRRRGFNPWVGKIPWRREWQPTPVFLPGEFHGEDPGGLQSMGSHRAGHD